MNNLQLDRNIVTYIIGMSLIASLLPIATGGPTITTIQMNDVELAYNGTNICDLSALNIENLGSLQINITWDTTVVDLERVIKADLNIANYINHEMGYVNITGYELSAKTGSFTIASFEFKAKGASGTTCDLDINYCELLTADPQPVAVQHQLVDGTASIQSGGLIVSAGGPYTGVQGVPLNLQGSASGGTQPYNYHWDLNDDNDFSDSLVQNPTWTWDETGEHTIKIKVTDSTNTTVIASSTVEITSEDDGGSDDQNGGSTDNKIPNLIVTVSPTTQSVLGSITFDASQSTDPDGDPITYLWDFGDNSKSTFPKTTHSYTTAGKYLVNLTVSDNNGGTNSTTIEITILSGSNSIPTSPTIDGTSIGHINTLYRYNFQSIDSDGDDLKYFIDWGDTNTQETEYVDESSVIAKTYQWSSAGRYILSVYAYDGELDSQISSKYVFIDARNVSSIGYITDDDSDGRFDMYHSNSETIHTQIEQFDNTMINIDSDGDGVFDHMFNTMTGVMDNDPSIDGDNSENLIIFSVLIIFVAFALIGAIILLRRKKL